MQAQKTQRNLSLNHLTNRLMIIAIIMFSLLGIGLYINNVVKAYSPQARSSGLIILSQADLEEKYGLRVNLIARTAMGGFIDVRLKITDGEKSKLLLADKENFPILATEQGVKLTAPEETTSQDIKFITGGYLFILYPNSANAIKPNATVTILFGNFAVEPIKIK
jgi:hypothetical protein